MKNLTLNDFLNLPMSNSKAYILGLVSPKIILAKINTDDKLYLLGMVRHGYQRKPTDSNLLDHYWKFKNFLENNNMDVKIKFNNDLNFYSATTKKFKSNSGIGFAICLEIDNKSIDFTNKDSDLFNYIREKLINEINKIEKDQLPYFIAATIDGRSSIDTSRKYISIDIDSDDRISKCLYELTNHLNMKININCRDGRSDSSRNNQFRLKKTAVKNFYKEYECLILSDFRKNLIKENIIDK